MNILEEFWYGNIEPAEYDTSSGKEYKELLQLISRNEDKLLAIIFYEYTAPKTMIYQFDELHFIQHPVALLIARK